MPGRSFLERISDRVNEWTHAHEGGERAIFAVPFVVLSIICLIALMIFGFPRTDSANMVVDVVVAFEGKEHAGRAVQSFEAQRPTWFTPLAARRSVNMRRIDIRGEAVVVNVAGYGRVVVPMESEPAGSYASAIARACGMSTESRQDAADMVDQMVNARYCDDVPGASVPVIGLPSEGDARRLAQIEGEPKLVSIKVSPTTEEPTYQSIDRDWLERIGRQVGGVGTDKLVDAHEYLHR